jgi:tetratricopeptide (TPR) repeat protein
MGRKKGKKHSRKPGQKPLTETAAGKKPWQRALPVAVLVLVSAAIYANTLDAPFQWDELPLILENPIIRDFDYFLEPSRARGLLGFPSLITRYFTYLTFALNYHAHGTGVTGYHIVNIAIHAGTTLALYWLVLLIMRTPALEGTSLQAKAGSAAFATALLFTTHPLQTEAVTYIFQRFALLAAFLYILSIALYLRWRLGGAGHWYLLAIAAAALAMKSKQNAFTLPLMIAALEFMFLKGAWKKRLYYLVPLLLTMLIIPFSQAAIHSGTQGGAGGGLAETISEHTAITPEKSAYLLTEIRVMLTYLRLFFLPMGQNLDYDYMEFETLLSAPVLLSLAALLAMAAAGIWAFRRSRAGKGELVLLSWGVLWFFLALSVESSVIPIPMVINEYRMYLPSAGLMTAFVPLALVFAEHIRLPWGIPPARALIVALAIMLGALAVNRNALWGGEISLWGDVVRKSPGKTRGMLHLGVAYEKEGMFEKSLEIYDRAIRIEPENHEIHYDIGVAHWNLGNREKAVRSYQRALELNPMNYDARNNIGVYFTQTGRHDLALKEFMTAAAIDPNKPRAHSNLSTIFLMKKEYEKAVPELMEVLRTAPPSAETYNKLGYAYHQMGRREKAKENYLAAIRLDPSEKFSNFNLGRLYVEEGEIRSALRHLEQALRLDPGNRDFKAVYEQAKRLSGDQGH